MLRLYVLFLTILAFYVSQHDQIWVKFHFGMPKFIQMYWLWSFVGQKLDRTQCWSINGMPPPAGWLKMSRSHTRLQKPPFPANTNISTRWSQYLLNLVPMFWYNIVARWICGLFISLSQCWIQIFFQYCAQVVTILEY